VIGRVLAIAINTFRETVRARVLYVLALAGVLTIGSSALLSPLALGETDRITKDIGLAAIDLLGLLIITLLGTTIVYKEIERRTIVLLLSKPIARYEFVLGKFLGLSCTLAVAVAAEMVCVQLAVVLAGGGLDPRLAGAAGMALVALLTVNAVAMLYASFSGPLVAAFLTGATYVAGRLGGDLFDFAVEHGLPFLAYVFYLLPNLASMDLRAQVVHGIAFDPHQVGLALAHGLSYTLGALLLAVLAFRRREFR
jgi:ABC-type transport system involved in multi-copper enzyme maturation permease subunit